jgi:hypothetical protein
MLMDVVELLPLGLIFESSIAKTAIERIAIMMLNAYLFFVILSQNN